jgi:hypothetical protein
MPRLGLGLGLGRASGGAELAGSTLAAVSGPGTFEAVGGAWTLVELLNLYGSHAIYLCGDGSATYVREDAGNGADGVQVDKWIDQRTTGGTNAVQDTDGKQPTLVLDGSDYALAFDGANSYLECAAWLNSEASTVTHLVVFRTDDAATSQQLTHGAGGNDVIRIVSNELYYSPAGSPYGKIAIDTDDHALIVVFDGTQSGNENRLRFWLDGEPVSPTYSGTIPAATGTTPAVRIGANAGNALEKFAGLIYIAASIPAALTTAQVAALDATLQEHLSWY